MDFSFFRKNGLFVDGVKEMRKAEDGRKKRFGRLRSFRQAREKETRSSFARGTGRKRLYRILVRVAVITVCNRNSR